MQEVFKSIQDYPNYQVSKNGRVKSLKRKSWNGRGFYIQKERILKPGLNKSGYYSVVLSKNGKQKTIRVHQLVAIAFLDYERNGKMDFVVDHKDDNKSNNKLSNLQVITQRENISKGKKTPGVTWHKQRSKWRARIRINGNQKHLGYFNNKKEASNAYQAKLKQLKDE